MEINLQELMKDYSWKLTDEEIRHELDKYFTRLDKEANNDKRNFSA